MFSLEMLVAVVLVLAITALGAQSFLEQSRSFSLEARSFSAQSELLVKADLFLKTCFPEGVAECDSEGKAFSHVVHSQAGLVYGNESGFCIKRVVLQGGFGKILRVCED